MKKITIFTPTYNRVKILPKLYNSLLNQTSDDFCWLIIDDGSSDGTEDLVNLWMKENKILINYIFQKNIGMVGAHNTAHNNMNTELCVCIDSDDYMPNDAVGRIISLWGKYGYPESAGMVGLDAFENGDIVGTKLPKIRECKFSELYSTYRVTGDKKFVHNREVFNKFLPYKFFKNEYFPVTSYLYLLIERNHKLLVFNDVFCIVEYQPDGLSMNLFKQYIDSPNSFAFYRIQKMKSALNFVERCKNSIHFVSSSIMANDYSFLKKSPYKLLTFFMIPAGIALYFYITKSNKKSILKIK